MKIRVYLLSYLLLFVVNFGVASLAVYSQEDKVIAQGNPPLTQLMVGKVIVLLDWALELQLAPEKELQIKQILIQTWQKNDREDIQGALEIIKIYEQIAQMSEKERNNARGNLKTILLQSIREDPNDELSRMLASAYQAKNSTSKAQANNPAASTAKNKNRVGADGFTGLYRLARPSSINSSGISIGYIVFFPKGNVFWRLPTEGLLYFDPAVAQKAYPNDWGTYEINGGEIRVLRGPERREYVLTINGERINNPKSLGGGSFRPVPASDGLKLDGAYRLSESHPSITFTENGNFKDEGFYPVSDGTRPDGTFYKRDTRGGSGTYLIEQNTLELRYSDGRVKRFPFIAFPENLAKAPAVDSFIIFYNDTMKRY